MLVPGGCAFVNAKPLHDLAHVLSLPLHVAAHWPRHDLVLQPLPPPGKHKPTCCRRLAANSPPRRPGLQLDRYGPVCSIG